MSLRDLLGGCGNGDGDRPKVQSMKRGQESPNGGRPRQESVEGGGRDGLGPHRSGAGSGAAVSHGSALSLSFLLQTWPTADLFLSPSASTRS